MASSKSNRIRKFGRASWWKLMLGAFLSVGIGLYLFSRPQTPVEGPATAGAEAKQAKNAKTAFEPTDWDGTPVAVVYVGILVLLVISCFAIVIAYPNSLTDVSRALRINPPGPRLQTSNDADLRRLRTEEDKRLNGYYWVDKQKGIAHIPIEEAMKKLARTGIAGFPKAQQ